MVIKNKLAYFSCDDNKMNYSQRNNKYVWKDKDAYVNWTSMCNVTSMVMAADYAGYHFPPGNFDQPEDNLAKFIMESDLIDETYKKKYPAMYKDYKAGKKGSYTPNEIHELLALGLNTWLGTNAVTFSTSTNFIEALRKNFVDQSLPIVVSGVFNGLHHIVCITGVAYDYKEENGTIKINSKIPKIVKIDDPWGNPLKGYQKGLSGNDIELTWDYCVKYLKPVNDSKIKWTHQFNEPVAIV